MPAKSKPTPGAGQISADFWDTDPGRVPLNGAPAPTNVGNSTSESADVDYIPTAVASKRTASAQRPASKTVAARATSTKTVRAGVKSSASRTSNSSADAESARDASTSALKSPRTARAVAELKSAITEELFNDFYRNRRRIYRLNFVRGVCFGLGVFIGGTVIISIVIAGLSWLIQTFPDFSNYIQWLVDILTRK